MRTRSPEPVAGVPLHPLAEMPNRCVLYTVSINQYDRPSSIGANVTCDTLFLHDANATRLSKWTAVRVTPTEGYSAKLKSRELKLRQPPFLRNSGYAHTIYIDANVGVRQDPAELLDLCNSSLCMFSVGRTIASEIQWLRSNQYASKNQTATLAQIYRSHLREQVWYGKVIVRRYGSPSLSCFEDEWLAAIRRPGAVQRDQVHINRALHACGQTIQDLRARPGETTAPYHDPHFQRFFVNHGPSWHRKNAKARKATPPRIPRRSSGRHSMPRGGPFVDLAAIEEVHLDLDHTRCRWGPLCFLFG